MCQTAVARKLDVPGLLLIVNKVPILFDASDVRKRVQETYDAPVAAVLPHSDEMMALGSNGIVVLRRLETGRSNARGLRAR